MYQSRGYKYFHGGVSQRLFNIQYRRSFDQFPYKRSWVGLGEEQRIFDTKRVLNKATVTLEHGRIQTIESTPLKTMEVVILHAYRLSDAARVRA